VAFGACACENSFALGGDNCNAQTSASPAVIACSATAFAVSCLVLLRFLPTLVGVLRHRSVLKMNAAGTSFIFAWVAVWATWMNNIAHMVRALYFTASTQIAMSVTGRIQIIFLVISVLNLAAAFVEMSSSVRLIHNVDKLRIPVLLAIVIASSLIIFTFLFTSTMISAAIGFAVVMILAICGIVGPILLYVRASRRMAMTEGAREPSTYELLSAIITDVLFSRNQMKRILGFTKSDSSLHSKDSKDSKGSREEDAKEKRASKRAALENEQRLTHSQKQEEKMISFLSRAVTMGFWLFACLLGFLGGVGWEISIKPFEDDLAYREVQIANMVEAIFLVLALHQILWFLDIGFRRAVAARRRISKYRSESKEMMPSKEDSKLDVLDESKAGNTGNRSREESKVVASVV
jgi:hypothetical protein